MRFEKKYTMTLGDYVSFNLFFHRKRLILTPIVFFVAMLVMAFVVFSDSGQSPLLIPVFMLIVAVLTGMMTAWSIFAIKKASKKQYRSSQAMQSENEIIIDEEGICEHGAYANTIVPWKDVVLAAESKDALYIHISWMQAFVIPKQLIGGEEDAVIRSLIKSKLEEKKCRIS